MAVQLAASQEGLSSVSKQVSNVCVKEIIVINNDNFFTYVIQGNCDLSSLYFIIA
jgi:hypothetical protein